MTGKSAPLIAGLLALALAAFPSACGKKAALQAPEGARDRLIGGEGLAPSEDSAEDPSEAEETEAEEDDPWTRPPDGTRFEG